MNDDYGHLPRKGFDLTITLGMVLVIMDSILAEFGPDHRATDTAGFSCFYVQPTETYRLKASCIVGQVFDHLGVLRALTGPPAEYYGDQIHPGLNNEAGFGSETTRNRLETVHGIFLTDDAHAFLHACQVEQDGGVPWGEAVETAAQKINEKRGEPTSQFGLLKIHEEVSAK